LKRSLVAIFFMVSAAMLAAQETAGSAAAGDAAPGGATVESSAGAVVRFSYENAKLQPASYIIEVNEQGEGIYASKVGDAAPPDAVGVAPQPQNRPVKVSATFRDQIFTFARQLKYFAISCDDSKGHIAFQGKKILSYKGPAGTGSCTYNWSKEVRIQKLTDHFQAMAFTLEEGRRLAVEHEHDRLGLDAELETLEDAVRGGRAAETGNIAEQLKAIVDDGQVMDRARSRAQRLLDGVKAR
jgi:hypothetical protein